MKVQMLMKIQMSFNPRQLAEKWVSITVLVGCVLITIGLIYLSYTADALGEGWTQSRNSTLEESGLEF